jgi:hypothetical protein
MISEATSFSFAPTVLNTASMLVRAVETKESNNRKQ